MKTRPLKPLPVSLCLLFFFFVEPRASEIDGLHKLFGLKKTAEREDIYVRTEAPRDTFSFYVSFRRDILGLHYCAGTLISPSYILTSASCMDPKVSGFGVENATAVVGAYDLETEKDPKGNGNKRRRDKAECEPEEAEISSVIMHDKYSNGTGGRPAYDARYDIAVVKLKEPAFANWSAIPLEVMEDCCDDVDFVSAGLGRTEDSGPYSISLEMATFPFMPYDECADFFETSEDKFLGKGAENMTRNSSLCVYGEAEYCQLDKGSGIFRWRGDDKPPVLVGLATQATRECSYGDPYVFANISFLTEWIVSVEGVLEDIAGSERKTLKCGEKDTTAKISGAVPAKPGRYPYAVSVWPDGKIHKCNGVLISPRHVLTTGTCVDYQLYRDPTQIEAYIGGIDNTLEDDDRDFEVIYAQHYFFHHRFLASQRDVNLAILELEKNSTKEPIPLPFQSKNSWRLWCNGEMFACLLDRDCCRHDLPLRVVGWGSRTVGEAHARELQEGVVSFVTKKECKETYGVDGLNPVSICAGNNETGVGAALCRGDDGTPLIMTGGAQDVLIGLGFTNTAGGCSGGQPAEFLKVAFFLKWIKARLEID